MEYLKYNYKWKSIYDVFNQESFYFNQLSNSWYITSYNI
jgi:hypothetical protein